MADSDGSGMTAGKVLGYAGIAVGGVMVAMAAGVTPDSVQTFFTDTLPGKFSSWFSASSAAPTPADPNAILGMSRTTTALVGSGVLATGLALNASANAKADAMRMAEEPIVDLPVEGGYAEQIAMNRAVMRMRGAVMAQNPELMGAARA